MDSYTSAEFFYFFKCIINTNDADDAFKEIKLKCLSDVTSHRYETNRKYQDYHGKF